MGELKFLRKESELISEIYAFSYGMRGFFVTDENVFSLYYEPFSEKIAGA